METLENAVARLRVHYSPAEITTLLFSHAQVANKNKLVLLLLVCTPYFCDEGAFPDLCLTPRPDVTAGVSVWS